MYVLCKSMNRSFPWMSGAPRLRDSGSSFMSSFAHCRTLVCDCLSAARTSLKSGRRWAWGCLQCDHTQTCTRRTAIWWPTHQLMCVYCIKVVYGHNKCAESAFSAWYIAIHAWLGLHTVGECGGGAYQQEIITEYTMRGQPGGGGKRWPVWTSSATCRRLNKSQINE